ncbi:MAG: efflux RND transporter permease subunit [Thiohalocapsa sp.]
MLPGPSFPTAFFPDVTGEDIGGYVQAAQQAVADQVELPAGYSLGWSGQYEYMQRAAAKLQLVVPAAIGIIVVLLFMNFRNLVSVLLILGTLALVGGYWLLYLLGYNQSVAAGAGFIALAGVAVEIGVLMIVYLDQALARMREQAERQQREPTRADLQQAVMQGALLRVRPIIMTVSVIFAGLLPIMLDRGTGSEVMRRIAAPMVRGMVTVTVLTLLVVPVIYYLWKGKALHPNTKEAHSDASAAVVRTRASDRR